MKQSIFGRTHICEKELFFSYEPNTEKITVYTGGSLIEIPNEICEIIGEKIETIANGIIFYKLSVPLSNDNVIIENKKAKSVTIANQIRPVEYFIENYQKGSQYTEIRLQFPELDYFIPSKNIASLSEKEELIFSRKSILSTISILSFAVK